jgi:hypothetical protein
MGFGAQHAHATATSDSVLALAFWCVFVFVCHLYLFLFVPVHVRSFARRALFPLLPLGGKGKHADGGVENEAGDADDDFEIVDTAKEGATQESEGLGSKPADKPVLASSLPPARAGPVGMGDDDDRLSVIEEALIPTPTGREADVGVEDEVLGGTGKEDEESNQIKSEGGAE